MAGAPELPMRNGCADWLYYNTDQWPFVRVDGRKCDAPDDQMESRFEAHLHCFMTLLNANVPFVILFDIRGCNKFPARFLKPMADFLNMMKGKVAENLIGSAILLESLLVRGVLSMLFTFHAPTRPCKVSHDENVATAWCQQALRDPLHVTASNTAANEFTPAEQAKMADGQASWRDTIEKM
jgi:hypothetical protein